MPRKDYEPKAARAVQLIVAGELTDGEVAEAVGVAAHTISRWRRHPKFAAALDRETAKVNASLARRAVGQAARRVDRLNRDWLRLQRVIDARAADPTMAKVPGGPTGLLTHNVKGVGKGEDFQLVDLYEVDTGLLAELRAIEQQAAKELGQWTEKTSLTTNAPVISVVEVVPPDAATPDRP